MGNCVSQKLLFLTCSLAEDQRGFAHLGRQLKVRVLNNDRTAAGGEGKREGKREANESFECVANVSLQQVGNVLVLFFACLSAQTMRGREETNGRWVRVCEADGWRSYRIN